jgi:acyl dehydratase
MAETQVYFEDVQEGQEMPSVTQHCDSQRLVFWAAGSGDFYQIHYDKDFAQSTGLQGVIVHGALKHALLGRMVHEWIGYRGQIKRIAVQYRGMDDVNTDVICKGLVTKKHRQDGENVVELEIWAETSDGRRTTPGQAVVVLPLRSE